MAKGNKVRDGYLSDLPEDIQNKVMNISKIIKDKINELVEDPNYIDLKSSGWAMSCIDEFKTVPSANGQVGSIRVFQKRTKEGKLTYECMVQLTGHFRNHQYGWVEDQLHELIKRAYMETKSTIRKKYNMTIKNEGDMGNPDEGFDVYPDKKVAEEMWNKLEDRKTKTIQENTHYKSYTEGIFDIFKNKKKFEGGRVAFSNLPEGLRNLCKDTTVKIKEEFLKSAESLGLFNKIYHIDDNSYGGTDYDIKFIADVITGKYDDYLIYDSYVVQGYHTDILVSSPIGTFFDVTTDELTDDVNKILDHILKNVSELFSNSNPTKTLLLDDTYSDGRFHETELYFIIRCDKDYTEKLINYINDPKNHPLNESVDPESNPDYNKEYNTEMTEKQARSTLRTLSQSIINNNKEGEMGKGKNKVSQYTANIYANIITKNLLPKWAPGYKKFSITLDSYQSFFTFEFKTPTMSQDFISRFVDGREPISGFLHRIPEIKVRMSPKIFHTMESPDDAFFFFKSAIQYYDTKVEKYCKGLMAEVLKMNRSMKHLISTTKLSGLVTLPMSLLFVFDDAHMNNKNTFELSQEDINAVNQFMKNIYTRYAAPEKEKKKIVDDVREMVKELRESCDESETIRSLYYLPEAVEKYLNGDFDNEMQVAKEKFEYEQIDFESMKNPVSYEVKYYQEKFGVKKLKKIPSDLVAYISIETEAIKDANDKMMIASYCLGKIEIVEWYIELLEVGSKKYIVPHNKPYLENVRTQLLACFKKIMSTSIPKNDRPLIDVQYPKGYEG